MHAGTSTSRIRLREELGEPTSSLVDRVVKRADFLASPSLSLTLHEPYDIYYMLEFF